MPLTILHRCRVGGLCCSAVLGVVLNSTVADAHNPLAANILHAERRVEAAPDDPRVLLSRAELRRAAGRIDGALADLELAASRDPNVVEVDFYRARALLDGGRPAAALEALERFIVRSPDHGLKAFALSLAAHALIELARPIDAAAAFDGAIAAATHPAPELYLARAGLLLRAVATPCALRRARAGLQEGVERLGAVASLDREVRRIARVANGPASGGRCPDPYAGIPSWLLPRALPEQRARPAAAADNVTAALLRGPYLQIGGSDRVVVRWRTDVATASWVGWGTSPGGYTWSVSDPDAATEHEMVLDNLQPSTTYYYACGASSAEVVAGGDANHFFTTSPSVGSDVSTRTWVLGDSGTGDANAVAVRDAFLAFSGGEAPDLWLMLGDNAYSSGTDSEYQTAVFDTYPSILRRSVLWPSIGNHDALSADSATQTGVYFDAFTLPMTGEVGGPPSGTEAYYAFDRGNLHFICLDSSDSSLAPGSAMLQWLEDDLAAGSQDWTIAFFHHPPYTHGSHDSDNPVDSGGRLFAVRENVLPILESYGVDLVLTGHSHSYERSFLVGGHYGTSETLEHGTMILDGGDGRPGGDGAYGKLDKAHDGAVYVVAGSSGKISGGTLHHPVMFLSLNALGSLVLDTTPDTLSAAFIATDGAAADWFTLTKPHVAADYRFEESLASARLGATELAAPGGVSYERLRFGDLDCPALRFAAGSGLVLDTSWMSESLRSEYSLALLFELDTVSAWRKLVDTADRSLDDGLYVHDGALAHVGGTTTGGGGMIQAATLNQVVFTRAADGTVAGYVDGTLAFAGSDDGATLITADDLLHLFVDDTVTGGDSSGGAVVRVRLFDRVLSAEEVAALDLVAPGQCQGPEIFSDGFESGDMTQWSARVPSGTNVTNIQWWPRI